MIKLFKNQTELTGPAGELAVPADDEITLKLAMLYEGQCEGLGPSRAARKFGYTKQRYFQLLAAYRQRGAAALQSQPRGPKRPSRRTGEVIRQVIRQRFVDPDASVAVITQKLKQARQPISQRSVERIVADYGLQKKTLRAGA